MSQGGGAATPTTDALTREAIARVDASSQLNDVLSLPEHLRDALWRVESAGLERHDSAGQAVSQSNSFDDRSSLFW